MNPLRATALACVASIALCPGTSRATNLYLDDFSDGFVAANINPLNGGTVTEAGGHLVVSIASAGEGFTLDLPTDAINCMEFTLVNIDPTGPLQVGDRLTWRWIVTDQDTLAEYTLLESDWEKTSSTTFTTRKKNAQGDTVKVKETVEQEDLDVTPPAGQHAKIRWDRRVVQGITQVQLEIVFVDANSGRLKQIVRAFDWQDPPAFRSTRFEAEANFPVDLRFEEVRGEDSHLSAVPTLSNIGLAVLIATLAALFVLKSRSRLLRNDNRVA